jgi:hypothetical protein
MTSIDGAPIDGDFLGPDVDLPVGAPTAAKRAHRIARLIVGKIGVLVLTGVFLAVTAAAVPVTAVYSFIWIAKI